MVATTIEEAAALGRSIAPHCQCGHFASFNGYGVWWRFTRKHWGQSLSQAKKRFYCRPCWEATFCKVTAIRLEVVDMSKLDVQLPMPPEREWKRAMRRVR